MQPALLLCGEGVEEVDGELLRGQRPWSTATLNFAFAFVDFGSAGATAFF